MDKDEALEQAQAMNRLLLEMVKTQKENYTSLIKVLIVVIVCCTALLISGIVGFFWYESQFEVTEEVVTTQTVTQEVSGENSEINNVSGDLYKDNAIHNDERGLNNGSETDHN